MVGRARCHKALVEVAAKKPMEVWEWSAEGLNRVGPVGLRGVVAWEVAYGIGLLDVGGSLKFKKKSF